MTLSLDQACAASMPVERLAALAPLRHLAGVQVKVTADLAWLFWEAGNDQVLRQVLPLTGAILYARRNGVWSRVGRHVPAFDVLEADDLVALSRVLIPELTRAEPTPEPEVTPRRVTVTRDARPRPASALRCELRHLARWVDVAPTAEIAAVRGARLGDRVMLLGDRLPTVRRAERFWGTRLLTPLGYRPEPALPADALREALGVRDWELLVLSPSGGEAIPLDAFRPLTRAGLRLALEGRPG
jgi:hypothetical protein